MVLVPFGPLRWYRLVRYDGTDSTATLVPIRPLRWYRLTDTITRTLDELLLPMPPPWLTTSLMAIPITSTTYFTTHSPV